MTDSVMQMKRKCSVILLIIATLAAYVVIVLIAGVSTKTNRDVDLDVHSRDFQFGANVPTDNGVNPYYQPRKSWFSQ